MAATIIDFNEFRKQREARPTLGIPGVLVWLHCPTCDITQYTALRIEGGRIHKCGTLVEEVEVPIDIRAEYTVSKRNLVQLEQWEQDHLQPFSGNKKLGHYLELMLKQVSEAEVEYQKRLESMQHEPIQTYADSWEPEFPEDQIKTIDPFGITLTPARQPEYHFPEDHDHDHDHDHKD